MLTKRWSVLVEGHTHDVVVSWNVIGSGGGLILVDGLERRRWLVGLKWPGVEKRFQVEDRAARVVQHSLGDFQLEVEGAAVSEPSRVAASAEARRLNRMGTLLLLAPIVGFAILLALVLAFLAAAR